MNNEHLLDLNSVPLNEVGGDLSGSPAGLVEEDLLEIGLVLQLRAARQPLLFAHIIAPP